MTLQIRRMSPDYPPCAEIFMTPAARRSVLLRDVDVVIDVGAEEGQYGQWIRAIGYRGRIISLEPTAGAFKTLSKVASEYDAWECVNVALGSNRMDAGMTRLRNLWPDLGCEGRIFLRINAEGFELAILDGASPVLDHIDLLEIELSVVPMYYGAPRLVEVLSYVERQGFEIVALEQNHGDDPATGQMLMIDGLFRRTTLEETRHHEPSPAVRRDQSSLAPLPA